MSPTEKVPDRPADYHKALEHLNMLWHARNAGLDSERLYAEEYERIRKWAEGEGDELERTERYPDLEQHHFQGIVEVHDQLKRNEMP